MRIFGEEDGVTQRLWPQLNDLFLEFFEQGNEKFISKRKRHEIIGFVWYYRNNLAIKLLPTSFNTNIRIFGITPVIKYDFSDNDSVKWYYKVINFFVWSFLPFMKRMFIENEEIVIFRNTFISK